MERMKEYNVRYCSTYEYDIKKDIEMIQDFYPETEHLVFVSDNTYNGLAELAWFKKNLQHFPQLSITYVDGRIHTLDMAIFPETQSCCLASGESITGVLLT